jgi:hypothetical protein
MFPAFGSDRDLSFLASITGINDANSAGLAHKIPVF